MPGNPPSNAGKLGGPGGQVQQGLPQRSAKTSKATIAQNTAIIAIPVMQPRAGRAGSSMSMSSVPVVSGRDWDAFRSGGASCMDTGKDFKGLMGLGFHCGV